MSVKDRGFASASKSRRRELARKGGQAAHAKGKAHTWSKDEALAAAGVAVANRKGRQAQAAALKVMRLLPDVSPQALQALQLSLDEWIYFGGAKSSATRIAELTQRLEPGNAEDE